MCSMLSTAFNVSACRSMHHAITIVSYAVHHSGALERETDVLRPQLFTIKLYLQVPLPSFSVSLVHPPFTQQSPLEENYNVAAALNTVQGLVMRRVIESIFPVHCDHDYLHTLVFEDRDCVSLFVSTLMCWLSLPNPHPHHSSPSSPDDYLQLSVAEIAQYWKHQPSAAGLLLFFSSLDSRYLLRTLHVSHISLQVYASEPPQLYSPPTRRHTCFNLYTSLVSSARPPFISGLGYMLILMMP
jgi:hypothetical protein